MEVNKQEIYNEKINNTNIKCTKCKKKNKKDKLQNGKNVKKLIIVATIFVLLAFASVSVYFYLSSKNVKNEVAQTNEKNENVSQVEIITDYINIRASNTIQSDVIGKVYKGEIYTILYEDKDTSYHWLKIKTSNNILGFISGKEEYVKYYLVEKNENEENEKTVEEPKIEEKETTINNKSNNNEIDNNEIDNNKNDNKTIEEPKQEEIEEIQKCNKTCESGYDLKNSDSVDCYCEKKIVEEVKEKIVDAQLEYYCPAGWNLVGETKFECQMIVLSDIEFVIKCPFGYVESEDGKSCVGEEREDTTYTLVPNCRGGSDQDIFSMTKAPYYGCRKGFLEFERQCGWGYTLKGSTCVWKYRGKKTFKSSTCPNEYPVPDHETGKCIKSVASKAFKRYKCSDDYNLVGKKCYLK